MPQLDFSTYPSQIFWLVICFVALYWLMSRVALPRIGSVIEDRRDRIAGDLDAAERLKEESERVIAAYESELAEARGKAHVIAGQARAEMAAELESERTKIEAEVAGKLADAEQHILTIKAAAMGELDEAATETCQTIVKELIGADLSAGEVSAAVKTARGA